MTALRALLPMTKREKPNLYNTGSHAPHPYIFSKTTAGYRQKPATERTNSSPLMLWHLSLSVLLLAVSAHAQGTLPKPQFEVASVKANKTSERMDYRLRADGVFGKNISAKGWIQIAYGVRDFQINSGPQWLDNEKFDIEGKTDRAYSARQMLLILQDLLADRFKLALHRETKQLPVYALVVSRNGLKMKRSKDQTLWAGDYPDGPPNGQRVSGASPSELAPGRFVGKEIPMSMFVNLISGPLDRMVVNRTGLTARFDIDLHYAPGLRQASAVDDSSRSLADEDAPSIFTALQEQLGLRLVATRALGEVLVLDHIQKPTPN